MTSAQREYVHWNDRIQQGAQAKAKLRERLGLTPSSAAPTPTTAPAVDPAIARWYPATNWHPPLNIAHDYAWNYNAAAWTNTSTYAMTTTTNASMKMAWINDSLWTMTRRLQDWSTGITMTNYWTSSERDEVYWTGWNTAYTETVEAREERQARDAERLRIYREQQAEHRVRIEAAAAAAEAADAVARELLLAHLSAQQKRDMLAHHHFDVIGSSGRRWRIHTNHSASGNIDLMPEHGEVRLASYCAHSRDQMPLSDHFLIQKIILEADEDAFIAVANVHYANPDAPRELIPDRRHLAA